ncbi:hypothetical protein E1301_Tti023755 [Triplophysa tibetana]|uniref:DUF4806 domain-containing protein n=1 Tax=Triplophysa tibetana TaxID=1572043 RepID=A0A5A9N813_9TELE|nr:hypothetical protein E1301_Tti023755 [Triplophysa tibetana]
MSYPKRWRKIRSEAAAIALDCSSEDDIPENVDNPNQSEVNGGENRAAGENSSSHDSDELGGIDSDFGYKQCVSTDSEEGVESAKDDDPTFQEKLASWATRTHLQTEEPIPKKQTRPPVDQQSSSSKQHGKRYPYPMPEAKFQRKIMEMLVEIWEDVRKLKQSSGVAEMHTDSRIPPQASTVEELNVLDKSLNCLEEKQRLINSLSCIGGMHLKDNVKRVMEKLMTNEVMGSFNMKGGKGKLAFTKLHLYAVVTAARERYPATDNLFHRQSSLCVSRQSSPVQLDVVSSVVLGILSITVRSPNPR